MALRSIIGVTSEVSVQSSPTNRSVPSGRFQVVGITARGPLNDSTLIRSIKEYQDLYGGRTAFETVYDTVRLFFQEGGAELYVTRVVGEAATNGSVTLRTGAETPVDSVTIEVVDPGSHSADYRAVVTDNTDGTFNVSVIDSVTSRVIAAFQRVESPQDLVSLAMGNELVIVRDLGAGANPVAGTFIFSAGSDDRASISAARYIAALDAHKGVRAGVAVAIPGQSADLVAAGLGQHCANNGKIGLLEIAAGASIQEAKAIGSALLGSAYSSYLSMPIFPAIRVPDGNDRTRVASPVGYAAAHRSFIHRTQSYAAAVAGPRVKTLWNFQPVTKLSQEDINELNQAGVNGIQSGNGAPFLNNWSSLSNEAGLYDLNVQDALNNLTVLAEAALQELIWKPNEGRNVVRALATSIIDGIMAPLVTGGYLFPTVDGDDNFVDDGYSVDIEDIRTSGQAAPYSEVGVVLSVKLSPTIRHIHLSIRKPDLRDNL